MVGWFDPLVSTRAMAARETRGDLQPVGRETEPTRVVPIAEGATSQAFKESVAKELAQGNCLYFMAWSSECEAWHDAVDMENIEQFEFKEIPGERFIMTTWHESEPRPRCSGSARTAPFIPRLISKVPCGTGAAGTTAPAAVC